MFIGARVESSIMQTYRRKMRYSDIRPGRHLSNTRYLRYVDDAVADMFDEQDLGVSALEEEGLQIVLQDTEISYYDDVNLGDTIMIDIRVEAARKEQIVLVFKVVKEANRQLLAEGRESFRAIASRDHKDVAVPETVLTRLAN